MSTSLVLGLIGAVVGGLVGGPVGAQIGWLAGSMIGSLIDPPKLQGPRLGDLKLQRSSYGAMIPLVFGTVRIAGNVIDQTDLQEHSESTGGKGGPEVESFTYSASFAILLCEGPILGVRRIWADGRVIWEADSGAELPCALYLGDETQLPDPTFEAIHGVGEVPAYRGTAYVVFTDYYLTDFGNRIPLLEFEIFTVAGTFPYRVSTFEPMPDPAPGTSPKRAARYEDGVVIVGAYRSASLVNAIYYERRFDLQGNDLGNEFEAEVDLPGFPSFFVEGLNVATDGGVWWQRDRSVGSVLTNPWGPATLGTALSGQSRVYNNGYIFGTGGGTISGDLGIARWPAPDGVVSGSTGTAADYNVTSANTYVSGDSLSSWVVGCTNVDDVCYVVHRGLGENVLYEYSFDLQTLNRQWDLSALHAVQPVVNGVTFTVYHSALTGRLLLACDRGTVGGKNLGVFYLNDDLTSEFVGQVDAINTGPYGGFTSNVTYLDAGYVLVADGIVALEPPPGGAILGDIVAALSARTPLTTYDTSELTDTVRGFVVGSQMTVKNAIYTLRQGFGFDAVESDDGVVFHKRDGTSIATIPDEDLCAHEYGADEPEPLKTTRKQEAELPRTVTVTYLDKDLDYQIGAQHSPRQVTSSESDVTLELPIVFTAGEAQQRAWTVQMGEWIERETFEWSLSRKWARLEPCDIVNVRGRVIRITNRIEMPSGVIQFRGVLSAPSIYTQNSTGSPAGEGTPEQPGAPGLSSDTDLLMLDLPLVASGDYQYGPYAAVTPASLSAWSGANVYKSDDGGTNYYSVGSTVTSDVVGTVATALGDFTGGNVFDESNSITVVIGYGGGTLSSASEEAVQNGANACALGSAATGWEVIQYRTATLTATSTYKLTGLLRGRRGTEWMMPLHGAAETFVALPPTININGSFAEIGLSRKYKAVTYAGVIADATAEDFTNAGVAVKPYAPVLLGGGRDASVNLTLTWTPRRRGDGGWPDGVDLPDTEPTVGYRVRIYTTSGYATVARTITTTSETASYTAAEQTTDFGSTQATVYWDVSKLGTAGYGYAARGTT